MSMDEESTVHSSLWTWEEDKAFENALAVIPENSADRWERIAEAVPGKTLEEIKYHYEILLDDIESIESGRVPLPCYASSDEGVDHVSESGTSKKGSHHGSFHGDSNHGGGKGSRSDQERRKGIAWTEDEHRLFLLGLERFGKGDWRSISRTYVVTRTPTQVASHAQKYFIRLNSMNKDRRRSSIHDITSVENGDVAAPQGPITGQTTNAPTTVNGGSSSKSSKQQSQLAPAIYGATTVGQPVAVGTPLNLSAAGHMAYGVRAPVAANMPPMAYSMPHASAHR